MIQIMHTDVHGWEAAIRGMRNPMNSWDKSDSWYGCCAGDYGHTEASECGERCRLDCRFQIGMNDLKLMKQLVSAGTDHSKFMRFINVTCDIVAPMYWWKEFDTYKVGTVRNSCSTMHKITAKKFDLDDFSRDHLFCEDEVSVLWGDSVPVRTLSIIIKVLNEYRAKYLECKNGNKKKLYWWQLIQLLPSSYNQRSTVQMNYAVLRNMYHARKAHKLDEWHEFCAWVEQLPNAELITGDKADLAVDELYHKALKGIKNYGGDN